MKRKPLVRITLSNFALLLALAAAWPARAQDAKAPYPVMAPLDQYLMERDAEIALARSAAPESVSGDAEVMVLGKHGFETAIKGKNGFVCLVERSWSTDFDDPQFWNPKLRAPICFNQPGARFNVPLLIKKTGFVFAARPKAQLFESLQTAFDKKELRPPEPGAMCYMLSKQGYLNDRDGHWHPHFMFFVPLTEPAAWGANLPGSQIVAVKSAQDRVTTFMIPVAKWSDGTAANMDQH